MDEDPHGVERPHAKVTKGTLARVFVIGLIASVLGVIFGLLIHWFPIAASKQAGPIDTLWDVLVGFSVPIFVIVTSVVLLSVWKFRMRPGEELLDGPPIHGNTRLEVVWTTIPALILLGLVTYAYLVLHDIEKAPAAGAAPEIRVQVTGQQFDWTFKYLTDAQGKAITNAKQQPSTAQLYLPVNESVKFDVKAVDVLHDFWVPAFRMKIDAVPGIVTHYRVQPNRTGSYEIVCAELCGLGHAFMRNTVHVMAQSDFQAWFGKQQKAAGGAVPISAAAPPTTTATSPATTPAPSTTTTASSTSSSTATATPAMLADGKSVFTGSGGCSGCHTLHEAGASGAVGPNLDKTLAKRDEAFIRTSIVDPDSYIEKGYAAGIMPSMFGKSLTKSELDDVVSYLYSVTHK